MVGWALHVSLGRILETLRLGRFRHPQWQERQIVQLGDRSRLGPARSIFSQGDVSLATEGVR